MKKTLLLLSLFLSAGVAQAQTYKKFSKVQTQQNDLSAYVFYAPSLFNYGHTPFEAEEMKNENSEKEEANKITIGGSGSTHLLGLGADFRLSQLPNFSIGVDLSLTKANNVLTDAQEMNFLTKNLIYSGVVKARHHYPPIGATSNFELSPFFGMGLGIYLDSPLYDSTLVRINDKFGYRKYELPTLKLRQIIQGTALVELGSRMSISDNMFAELGYSAQTLLSYNESVGSDSANQKFTDLGKPTHFVHSIKVGFGLKLSV